MQIYLAARYSRRAELSDYATQLKGLGHTITSRWLLGEHEVLDKELMSENGTVDESRRRLFAMDDLQDLTVADCVISFTEPQRTEHTRGGRHVEFGIGYALGKRSIIVGHRENVFHALPNVEYFARWQDAFRQLIDEAEVLQCLNRRFR